MLAHCTWSLHFTLHGLSRPDLVYSAFFNLLLEMMILGLGKGRPISAILHGLSWFNMAGISFYGAVPICPWVACALNYLQGANFHMTRLFLGNFGYCSFLNFHIYLWPSELLLNFKLISKTLNFYFHLIQWSYHFLKMKMKKQNYLASIVGLLCKK